MSKERRSLQDLTLETLRPISDRGKRYLRMFVDGRLLTSNGEAWRYLQKSGLCTADRTLTPLAINYTKTLKPKGGKHETQNAKRTSPDWVGD